MSNNIYAIDVNTADLYTARKTGEHVISKYSANPAAKSLRKKIRLLSLIKIRFMHMAMTHMQCMKRHRRQSM